MKNISTKKASSYYFFGTFFNKGIAFFTVPIFTRLLSTADYGIITTYNSWIAIFAMIVGFALHSAIRIAFIDYKNEMKDFMATITSFTLISGIILSVFIILFSKIFLFSVNTSLIILCLFQSIGTALIEDYSMYLMMQYRYKFRTILMIFPNLIAVVASVITIKFFLNNHLYLGRIIPTALTIILFGILICFLIYSESKCFLNHNYLKYALTFSLPLILHGIALNILSQSDRTMITWLADSSQTGIYSLIYNFSMIATVITTSLEGIWIPWFYKKLQDSSITEINLVAKDYINLMTYCLIGVMMIGPEIVKLLASSSYWDGIKIIPPVVFSNFMIFAYTLYVNVEHYHKQTKVITVNTLIAAFLNIFLNYLLIPKYGYVAAAYTTLVSYFISFILHSKESKKLEPNLYSLTFFAIPLFEIVISSFLFYIFLKNVFIRWGILLVFLFLKLFKERNRIIVYFPNFNFRKGKK